MEFLNLNKLHVSDRIIPKESLYKNAELTEKEKQYFVNSVERVKLHYALTTGNSNINGGIVDECSYDEIIFIELKLKNLDNIEKILKIVHSSIPKPLVIVGSYGEKNIISVALKTNNNRVKINEIFTTIVVGRENLKELSFEKIRKTTLFETYMNYINFVKMQISEKLIKKSNLTGIEIKKDKVDEFLELQKELERLSEQMKNEIQLKKRVELSLEISRVKEKIIRQ